MSYYWTNLAAHLLVSLILLIIFLAAVKGSQEYRWKKGFLFLLPSVLMIVLLIQLSVFSIPRVLDSTTVLRSTYRMESGKIESISQFNNTVVINGITYYVNPFDFELEVGDEVSIKYTPYAHYAYSLEKAEPAEAEEKEEKVQSKEK